MNVITAEKIEKLHRHLPDFKNESEVFTYIVEETAPLLQADTSISDIIAANKRSTAIDYLSHKVKHHALGVWCDLLEFATDITKNQTLKDYLCMLVKIYGNDMEKIITKTSLERIIPASS